MKKILLIPCVLLFSICSYAQSSFTLSGVILEDTSNETLIGVTVAIPSLNTGVVTNEYGFYSITLPEGTYRIQINYLGFQTIEKTIELYANIKLNMSLKEDAEQLSEIVISADPEKISIRKPEMSVNKLTSKTIKKIPAILGEADVIKSIQLLPGVSSAGEASSGFNVRGGTADQNLILLDEAIVFNSSHLFGFFSVFNPDAIKELKLYKGGIPSKYGGRLSSVLDIYQKEGNSKQFKMTGGIGAVASRLLVEGPLKKDKGSFLLGGRASYAHLFLALADNENVAYFYDLNTKLSYKLNETNSIYASGYFGRDLFNISDSFETIYGNTVANVRWNHLFSDKLFSNLSLIYSDYYYGLEINLLGFQWNSGIENFNIKYDLKQYLNDKVQLNYGINNIYYRFNPGEIEPNSEGSGVVRDKLTDKFANEFAAYLDIEHTLSERLTLRYGLRWSHFTRLGQDELFAYENNEAVVFNPTLQIYQGAVPIGTETYDRSDVLSTFNNFEPRFSASYLLDDNSSIKLSYNRMAQYLHLLSNTSSPTPLDVWTPSGPFIEPQLLDQVALGYYKDFKDDLFSLETEVFYKDIDNRIDYIDGADLIANDAIEQVVLTGEARAYGLEILFRKNKGKFRGWLAYTLSKSEQRTEGRTPNEPGINNGNWYNTPFDKTHDISINGSYELSDKWSFNTNFLFQTGQPTNFPIGQFEQIGLTVPIYGDRNVERLPSYHRLDISATYIPKGDPNTRWQSEWTFGFYNLYNRRNAASINFRENIDTGNNEAIRTSIFGVVPSITYNFKF